MNRGPAFALLSALLFGASTPFAKLLLGSTSPGMLAGLLYLGAGLGLAGVELLGKAMGRRRTPLALTRAEWGWFMAAAAFGGVLGPLALTHGLLRSTAASAALMLNLESVLTALLAWFVFKENFDRRIAVGMALIAAGTVMLSWTGGARAEGADIGLILVAAACLCWAIDNNLMRQVAHGDAVRLAAYRGAIAGSTNLAIASLIGDAFPPLASLPVALVVGFLGYGLSIVLFVVALREIGTARTGAYFATAPFAGTALAIALLGEPMSVQLAIAAALMATGVWLHLTERHEHEHEHVAEEHVHAHTHDEHHAHQHAGDEPRGEPHVHGHAHVGLRHHHAHFPDSHHRHGH